MSSSADASRPSSLGAEPSDTQRNESQIADAAALQAHLLYGVSRTFALTIPQLPGALGPVVANNYLLCRIIDTIEDEPALDMRQKDELSAAFVEIVAGRGDPERFAARLAPQLSEHTLAAEHELVRRTPEVIAITAGFSDVQRQALERCTTVMADGMVEFQRRKDARGLADLSHLGRYCYVVAGIVGETVTRLFCDYSQTIGDRRDALMARAVSFGQGLQMTNILKDIWDDRRRGACWLPRDVFDEAGFDLSELTPGAHNEAFGRGLVRLIGIAHAHLREALDYTLLIPREEIGIRNFCLWAIGFAVLTLRKLHRDPGFGCGGEVKISRRSVKATMLASRLSATRDPAIRSLFWLTSTGLPLER